jgi:hypothetical protein
LITAEVAVEVKVLVAAGAFGRAVCGEAALADLPATPLS